MKKINRIMAVVFALLTGAGMSVTAACKDGGDSSELFSSQQSSGSSLHLCEHVCPDCGACEDAECEELGCREKCDCSYTLTWVVENADVFGEQGLPKRAKRGETVSFRVEAKGERLTVTVNGRKVEPVSGNEYKLLVTADLTVEIKATPFEKTYTLTDATVAERGGKPYYVLKGTYENYTEQELKEFYFDMQNNANYNAAHGWTTTVVSYELECSGNTFSMYVDLSGFPEDVCLIPHFNGRDASGDVKVWTSDGASITLGSLVYTLDMGASGWGLSTVTIVNARGFVSAPSDTTPPTMSAITNHAYAKTTELPRIDIATENGLAIDDESLIKGWKIPEAVYEYDYVNASISVSNCEGYEMEDTSGEVKVRGNYTSTYSKKPIRIKFTKKQGMCGLNGGEKFKNWVLLAEYKDSSMLRNSLAFYFGNTLLENDGLHCTDFRYVEVYLNGSYNGLYLLVEQQETKSGRIDLPEAIDPEDEPDNPDLKNVKIGYSIEYDGYYYTEKASERFEIDYDRLRFENGTYMQPGQRGFTIKSDVYFEEQRVFIQKCMQNIWDIIYNATHKEHTDLGKQPYYTLNGDGEKVADATIKTPREAVEKVVDVRSLADVYILNEICQDADLGWSSFYMSLDMSETGDKRLRFEAPWDFDSALGNSVGDNTKLFALNQSWHNAGSVTPNPWLMVCSREAWFWTHVQARWEALENAGTFAGALELIDYFTANYAAAYAKNFERWSECIGRKIEDQQVDIVATFKTQADAAAYLKTWLSERIDNLGRLIDEKVTFLTTH